MTFSLDRVASLVMIQAAAQNIFYVFVKPFSVDDIQTGCHFLTKSGFQMSAFKTKTKVITLANHKGHS